MEQILKIAGFILDSFIHIWPYLLITIPLAVAVQLTGAAKFINKAFGKNPFVSIVLATLIGAISPFCSCGVIPVIASLLIGGVPLGPVMSFWIASPSMDPEIFFLSTATIGWKLSVWRLAATFAISLLSGFLTHLAIQQGILGRDVLKENKASHTKWSLQQFTSEFSTQFKRLFRFKNVPKKVPVQLQVILLTNKSGIECCVPVESHIVQSKVSTTENINGCNTTCKPSEISFYRQLLNETRKALFLVVKFMSVAFLLNALIQFYVPLDFISSLTDKDSFYSVILAAITGVPVYTSNITALPLISVLLESGMNEGAALAFLISGPVTTLPAIVAVWGIVRKKIFIMYISFALIGAVVFGLLINLFG